MRCDWLFVMSWLRTVKRTLSRANFIFVVVLSSMGFHHYCVVNSLCQKKTYVLELTFWMRTLPFNMALLYWESRSSRKHPRRPRADGQLGRAKRRRKISRTGERAPRILFLTNQFHDSFECLSVIWNKFCNRRPASIALLSWSIYTKEFTRKLDCSPYGLARAGEFSSRRVFSENSPRKTKGIP